MKLEGTVQYNSLSWVKKQLDAVLHDAQTSLSDYIEDNANTTALEQCIEHLRLVYGTLQMVEVYGAAMLAEEMEQTARAQLEGRIESPEDVYDVLMRAMLQLPDYLEGLQAGNQDAPIVLMPLMNDMRAVRKEKLLSESVLFMPDINAVDIEELGLDATAIEPGKLTREAKRLRTHYQLGLLDILRNNKYSAGLKRTLAVLIALQKVTADETVKRFWMVASALLEAIEDDKDLQSNIAVKGLLGAIDRQIKLLVDVGENRFIDQMSQELLKNILYYVGSCRSTGVRVSKIKQAYKLEELLSDKSSAQQISVSMGGINAELFDTVSQGIREDLTTVKDTLEIFMQSSDKDVEQLSSVVKQIEKIADTYGMLGFGSTRQNVLDQRIELEKIISGELEASEQRVLEIAGALLAAESKLDDYIAGKSGLVSEDDEERVIPSSEYRKVLVTVIEEAHKNFVEAKEAILAYANGSSDESHLETVVQRLEEVRGVAMMLSAERVEKLISSLMKYVRIALQAQHRQPDSQEQDTLADVVTSIEYYFEALSEGRPGVDQGLLTGERAQADLSEITKQYGAPASADIDNDGDELAESVVITDDSDEPEVALEITTTAELEFEQQATTLEPEPEPEHELPAATEPVESVKTAAVEHEEYGILSEDADEEIVEIFIEEAVEVMDSLNEHVPKWKQNYQDEESLTVIRRNFHTLKGSGRLIGAALIGEFAWKIENLLNRVLDKKIEVTDELLTLLDEVLAVVPQLIEQLRGNREPIANIYQLMTVAVALTEGQAVGAVEAEESLVDEPDRAAAEESQSPTIEVPVNYSSEQDYGTDEVMEVSGDISAEDEMFLDALNDMDVEEKITFIEPVGSDEISLEMTDAFASEDNVFDISETDDFNIRLEGSLLDDEDDDDGFIIEIDESSEQDEVESNVGLNMDSMLFQIYYDESNSHLRIIKELLNKHYLGEQGLEASNDLIRAFHTLFGSARTAEIEAIAEIAGVSEKYAVARQDASSQLIPDAVVEIIAEVVSTIEAMLAQLKANKLPETNKVLLDRMSKAVQDELQQQLQQPSAAQIMPTQSEAKREPVVTGKPVQHAPAETLYTYGDVDDDLIDIFLEEAEELIEDLEGTLIKLHENEEDTDNLIELQRHMHTLKGGARMASLVPVGDLTHVLESMVLALFEHKIEANKVFFDVLHESLDALNNMLGNVKQRQPISASGNLVERIEAIMRGEVVEQRTVERFDVEVDDLLSEAVNEPLTEEMLNPEIQAQNPAAGKGIAGTADAEALKRRKSDRSEEKPHWGERATDVNFKDSQEQVRVRADLLNNLVNYAGEVNIHHARMGKQITDVGYNLKELNQTVIRLKEQLRKLEIETEIQIRSSYEKEADDYDENFDPLEMDRYSTLQQLARSLSETASDVDSIKDILSDIVGDAEMLLLQESRISTDLQEGLMRTRMVRFGGMSTRLRRIVRQTAREMGKEINVEIIGEEQELDRTVLDRVVAPLEHMLRNAVAHGIELPKDRLIAGKSEAGNIKISVGRQGTSVVVKVEDDGSGINADAIRKKAIKQGLLAEDNELSNYDVLQFILKSGFSTAEEVTQLAGRGVGMDVVDSEIKQLGGVLEIDTERGKGTSFKVRLPLTLAINQALLVNAGDDIYAVPLASIEGVVRITGTELQSFYDSGDLEYAFNNVNYELKHLGFMLTGHQQNYAEEGQLFPVLLVHVGDQHFALHVDDLLGRREIVIKPVGMQISAVRGIAGATILADGRVVLILEMSALVIGDSLFKEVVTEESDEAVAVETEPTIMVVDDSITIRKVTARILERHNMKVILATDGVDATNKLQEEMPDLMLLDIEMPKMDGFELATYMRNEDRLKQIPIIMITSRTGIKHKERAKTIGVDQYLGKPFQEEELMKNINELLSSVK
ncbi:MAG: Hpt domain-containing protein [Gammaproteobacteria bacterium]|nr:Hpt domain-containing protein [Gammaproteobacteria bacterium]